MTLYLREYILDRTMVEPFTGCWLWTLSVDSGGYGRGTYRNRSALAHRISYEAFKGPIPGGLQLDHLCRVRSCVNPEHLEPVTAQENVVRGRAPKLSAQRQLQKTHCPSGHVYDAANTRMYRGRRYCRACNVNRRRKKVHVK